MCAAARAAEDAQRAIAFEDARASAVELATAVQAPAQTADWDAPQATKRSAATVQLIADARNPATPRADAIAKARRAALELSAADGSWTKAEALRALAGSDDLALEFARTIVDTAAGQDDRTTLIGLLATGTDAMRTAATAALAGSDADVAAFLVSKTYPGRVTEDRVAINQVLSTAHAAGYTVVVQRAQQALDDGTGPVLRAFLADGRYAAETVDQRIKVNQVLADPASGPELRNAAQVALDGPQQFIDQFLTVEQFRAARDDQDSAAHNATVLALLTQGSEAAAKASENALLAQAAAARARAAQAEADFYVQQAAASAAQAAGYAAQAKDSAAQATASALKAAASAATAQNAATAATNSAKNAAQSAAWAYASAQRAASSASVAIAASDEAFASWMAATGDAILAKQAATAAYDDAMHKAQNEHTDWINGQRAYCYNTAIDLTECMRNVAKIDQNAAFYASENARLCGVMYRPGTAFQNCIQNAMSPSFVEDNALAIGIAVIAEAQAFMDTLDAMLTVIDLAHLAFGLGKVLFKLALRAPLFASKALLASAFVFRRSAALLEQSMAKLAAQKQALSDLVSGLLGACARSFPPGTQVLLAGGGSRSIDAIRVGDLVRSTDPVTGATDDQPVTDLLTGSGTKTFIDVVVDTDGDGGAATGVVTATDNHPFWVADAGIWVEAGDLRGGEWLRTSSGTWVQVTATTRRVQPAVVHNLTVAEHHTYYVLAGTTPVLVHNATCGPAVTIPGLKPMWDGADRLTIEAFLGGNMPVGFPYIDAFDEAGRVATSIKTIDWRFDSYRISNSAITSTGKQHVNDLLNFSRNGATGGGRTVSPDMVDTYVLKLAFPFTANMDPGRMAAYEKIVEYGAKQDPKIIVELIPVVV